MWAAKSFETQWEGREGKVSHTFDEGWKISVSKRYFSQSQHGNPSKPIQSVSTINATS